MSSGRETARPWVFKALKAKGGTAPLIEVAEYVWDHYSSDILADKKLLLTWQYEMRQAATVMRKQGIMNKNKNREPWSLSSIGKGMTSI